MRFQCMCKKNFIALQFAKFTLISAKLRPKTNCGNGNTTTSGEILFYYHFSFDLNFK